MPIMVAALQWMQIGQAVFSAGMGVWSQVKAVLAANNIAADTDALDELIADAERRKAMAEAEARG